jgi:hypothetical protein
VVFERVDRGYVSTTTDNHYSNVLVAKRYSLHVAAAHQVRTTTAPATVHRTCLPRKVIERVATI